MIKKLDFSISREDFYSTTVKLGETVNMSINDTYNIEVTIVPNNAVDKRLVYTSSNESIVTVDQNGLVRAINRGYSKVVISSYNDPNIKVEISFYVK